jgi:hypothetical protein
VQSALVVLRVFPTHMCILTLSSYGGINVHHNHLSIVHCITEWLSAPLFTAQVIFR